MKMPGNCPICKGPMIHDYDEFVDGKSRMNKFCNKNVSHKIKFTSTCEDHDHVNIIRYNYSATQEVIWGMEVKYLGVKIKGRADLWLPFFEPDFSNPKLLSKIKTYVIFS